MDGVGSGKLHVYECRGGAPGWEETGIDGFLGAWPEGDFCYLFFDRPVAAELDAWLSGRPGCVVTGEYRLDYAEWQQIAAPVEEVGPFRIVKRGFAEAPAGVAPEDPPAGLLIRLEPGLAFGSGIHPTTRGCLLALADLFARNRIRTALDLGTGTGILAIACARLGARNVVATDRTPLAMRAASANVRANDLEGRVHLLAADGLAPLSGRFDLLIANIEPAILGRIMRPGDWRAFQWVVLSGFLEARRHEVEAFLPPEFIPTGETRLDGWLTLTGRMASFPFP